MTPDDSHIARLKAALDEPAAFWANEAQRIDWFAPFTQVFDTSNAPHTAWFVGGQTNLCHNAVDRHLPTRPEQAALHVVSAETGMARSVTYRELHREVNVVAAMLQSLGVGEGDRVVIYLPMIAEAVFTMLACARIGAVHSVVFGGVAAASLATRIADAQPALIVTADAGFQNGVTVAYRPLVRDALAMRTGPAIPVLRIDRGLVDAGAFDDDARYADLHGRFEQADVPCAWLDANAPSYILYTSGTTGQPKGVLRDVGGHAVALATSLHHLFGARAGDTMFTTSDLGWVVGHSYGVYGPLICGMTSVLFEGTPLRPDSGVWWRLVEQFGVNLMLSSPTAMRLFKRHGIPPSSHANLSTLRTLFLAGEPLDAPTSTWAQTALGIPVVDHYWQTESGWPMLALPQVDDRNDSDIPLRTPGSPGLPSFGFNLKVVDDVYGLPCLAGEKGRLVADGPLPPGCFATLWQQDEAYRRTYWSRHGDTWRYATFDWAVTALDGQVRVLGRSDDVILVAGKRIGTREIEEVLLAHPGVAEAAVVGIDNELRGQVPLALVVPVDASLSDGAVRQLEIRLIQAVSDTLGKHARPRRVILVRALPRTRSGKVLRRLVQQAIADLRATGPAALEHAAIAAAVEMLATMPDAALTPSRYGSASPAACTLASFTLASPASELACATAPRRVS